jgi:hypothetical protein
MQGEICDMVIHLQLHNRQGFLISATTNFSEFVTLTLIHQKNTSPDWGHAIAQAVSRWLPTAAAPVQVQA